MASPDGAVTRSPLAITLAASALLGFAFTIIWALTGAAYYWPAWIWLGGYVAVAAAMVATRWWARPAGWVRWLEAQGDLSIALSGCLVLVWCFTGADLPFWPVWPIMVLAILWAGHALVVYADRVPGLGRTRVLEERVETLTRTRSDALDLQTTELRRIERDLHDGAQARLVALSMQLGRAETRLANDPEAAALVKSAREEAGAAIAELRDLVRGIAPPLLTDRGLVPAVTSLADRSAVPVTVEANDMERLPAAVEVAAYFIVAEALTNVSKHAPKATARVTLSRRDSMLVIDVADNGPGHADPNGAGLTGLRSRAETLDGTLTVVSPSGGPTVVHAELPCR